MIKRIFLALSLICFGLGSVTTDPISHAPHFSIGATAQATEINTDVGFDNPSAWMLDPATSNLWTVSGSKANGNGATAGSMLMQSSTAVKKGHHYLCRLTMSSYVSGAARCTVGLTMSGTVTAPYVTAASITPVADTFTTSLGLNSGSSVKNLTGPGDMADETGAFRFTCSIAGFSPNDAVVYPGLSGRSHLHAYYGNTEALNAGATYNSLRTKGMSTCGNFGASKNTPINRSGYWMPTMLDGLGHALEPSMIETYYKGPPDPTLNYTSYVEPDPAHPHPPGLYCPETSPTNNCPNIPNALRYTFGYNMTAHTGGPTDLASAGSDGFHMNYECWGSWDSSVGSGTATGTYHTIADMVAAGCPTGAQMHLTISFPTCWDGVYVDTPNHRDHMMYANQSTTHFGNIGCPADHPIKLPEIGIQVFYPIDAAFQAGLWHLSSDEMVAGAVAGTTLHADYFMAWSPAAFATEFQYCQHAHNSCSSGDLGNGTAIKDAGGVTHSIDEGNGTVRPRDTRYVPTANFGMGPDCKANGVCTVELIAPADGKFALMAYNGFVGSVDGLSLTEISTAKGPVTVH